jgi:hypothetical protein
VPGKSQGGRLGEQRQIQATRAPVRHLHPLLLLPGVVPRKGDRPEKTADETIVREKEIAAGAGPRGKAALTADCRLRTNTC